MSCVHYFILGLLVIIFNSVIVQGGCVSSSYIVDNRLCSWYSQLVLTIGIHNWYSQLVFTIGIHNWYSQLVFTIGIHNCYSQLVFSGTRLSEKQPLHSHRIQSTSGTFNRLQFNFFSKSQINFLFPRLGPNAPDLYCSSTMRLSTSGLTCSGLSHFSHFCYGIWTQLLAFLALLL